MTENYKLDHIVKEIIRTNPDIETCKKLIQVLTHHYQFKSKMREAIDPALWGLN